MADSMKNLRDSSYLFSSNAAFVEEQYAIYLRDPTAVSEDWRAFFAELPVMGEGPVAEVDHHAIQEEFKRLAREPRGVAAGPRESTLLETKACLDAK